MPRDATAGETTRLSITGLFFDLVFVFTITQVIHLCASRDARGHRADGECAEGIVARGDDVPLRAAWVLACSWWILAVEHFTARAQPDSAARTA